MLALRGKETTQAVSPGSITSSSSSAVLLHFRAFTEVIACASAEQVVTIEAERMKLLQANAVQRCLYAVLLYADGEDAVTYAEAAHVVATLIDDCVARLDSVRLRPQIEELERGYIHQYAGEQLDSGSSNDLAEDSCAPGIVG